MKPAIAGTILLIVWLVVMVIWGMSKDIKPDLSQPDESGSKSFGHPIWNE